jgi:hypothetical protein
MSSQSASLKTIKSWRTTMIKNKFKTVLVLPLLLIFSGLLVGAEAAQASQITRTSAPKVKKVCNKGGWKGKLVCELITYVVVEVVETAITPSEEVPEKPVYHSGKGMTTRTGGSDRVISRRIQVIRRTRI